MMLGKCIGILGRSGTLPGLLKMFKSENLNFPKFVDGHFFGITTHEIFEPTSKYPFVMNARDIKRYINI